MTAPTMATTPTTTITANAMTAPRRSEPLSSSPPPWLSGTSMAFPTDARSSSSNKLKVKFINKNILKVGLYLTLHHP